MQTALRLPGPVRRLFGGRESASEDVGLPPEPGFLGRHAVAYGLASVLTFIALLVSVSGGDVLGPGSMWLGVLLAVNSVMIGYLGIAVASRLLLVLKARRDATTGARLHLRFVGLFALAAVVPAVVIALFSGLTIGRGMQAWFTDQVRGGFEATRVLAQQTVQGAGDSAGADLIAMAADADAASAQILGAPDRFRSYLASQADRRGFVAAYVLDSRGAVITSAQRPGQGPPFVAPGAEDFAFALAGNVQIEIDEQAVIRGLVKLRSLRDAYLMVVRLPAQGQPELLRRAEQAVRAFQTIEERQGWLQIVFVVAYVETVMLVLIGAAWLGLVSATRISRPIARLAKAAEQVQRGDLAARVDTSDGVIGSDEIGALALTFNAMTDDLQTQRAAIEEAREQAEGRSAFIRAVLEGVAAGVVGLSPDGRVTAANSSAGRLLRVEGKLEGRTLSDLAPQFAPIIARARPGQPASGQIEREAGLETQVLDVRAAFAGEDVVVTFDDVSSLLAAQRQTAWKDVARRIAHEIKNPLTPIQLSAERLRRKFAGQVGTDRDAFERMTDTIVRQVGDIGRMVDEFSAFARMPAPKFAPDDVAELLRQAAFAQRLTSPDIEIVSDTPPEPILVSMDSRLIAQAFANLLKNAAEGISAARAAHGGEAAGEIAVSLSVSGAEAQIEFVDDGIGFPVHDRRRLLEPYVTTRAKGTGLGLAIVSRVLEEHGGRLDLLDRADGRRGARVSLSLPLVAQTLTPAPTPGPEDLISPQEHAHGV